MTYEKINKSLAPCGLNCVKCMAYAEGDIKRHAAELTRLLGSFDIYAERFSKFAPVFANYPSFKELLAHFSSGSCRGCRAGECIYPNCGVGPCTREKGIDFCFECGEFPCEKSNFDPHLKERWITMNERMKEIGPEGYWEETKDQPRYR
ncbi:MAG: DUF3795 domain-containing protein [Deltaproteobacteria bacterium]|nr:DUF3795 domain-containing protein [Candidatus Zymogenaceae bacterium]